MIKIRLMTFAVGLGFAFLGAACENIPEYYKGASEIPRPVVSVDSTVAHEIQFSEGEMDDAARDALQRFVYEQGIRYGDELSFDFAPGDTNVWGKKAVLDNYLKTIGIWVDGVTQSGNNRDPSSVVFVVTRYKATTPDCYALSREAFVPTEMETNKVFGCITAHNLGVHVANKKDLMEGRPDTLGVTTASVRAIQLYRARFGLPIVATASSSGSSSGSSGISR